MATIQEFYTTAARRDFARLFQFRLAAFANIEFKPAHYAYVESASLPGRSITNVPVPYMGLSFNLPGTVTYPGSTGYQVTFRCTSTGEYGLPGDDRILQLELLDKKVDKPVRIYTLYGVYVQSLADTAYTVTDTGSVATIQATLAYQFWRAGKVVQSNTTRNPDGIVNNVGAIIPRSF